MPLYFAYGANMDVAAMATRAPHSRLIGPARLPRHRFMIMAEGYATVVRDPRFAVHGLLWDLALADVRPLDRFEAVDRGLYVKMNQPVITPEGSKRALVYVATSAQPGKAKPGYLESILTAAEVHGLPDAYRREITALGGLLLPDAGPAGPRALGKKQH